MIKLSPGQRIKERIFWYKNFAPFLFAHKPLCERFRQDRLRLHTMYVCRGCFFLVLGLLSWSALFLHFGTSGAFRIPALALFFSVIIIGSFPQWYCQYHRVFRDFLRFHTGGIIAFLLWLLTVKAFVWFGGSVVLLFLVRILYNFFRMIEHDQICQQCDEYLAPPPCSGFALKRQKMLAYEAYLMELCGKH